MEVVKASGRGPRSILVAGVVAVMLLVVFVVAAVAIGRIIGSDSDLIDAAGVPLAPVLQVRSSRPYCASGACSDSAIQVDLLDDRKAPDVCAKELAYLESIGFVRDREPAKAVTGVNLSGRSIAVFCVGDALVVAPTEVP